MSQYPTLHPSVIFSLSCLNTTKQRREAARQGARSKEGRRFGILATEQNNSEIIAPGVYSSITQRAEPWGEGTFAFF